MRLKTRLDRLETSFPTCYELWAQDDDLPEVFHHNGLTLDGDALNTRAEKSPGLRVIRFVHETRT